MQTVAGDSAAKAKQDDADPPPVAYSQLFRFANHADIAVLVFGIVCSIVNGLVMPTFTIFFGRLLDDINAPGGFLSKVTEIAYIFLYLGAVAFVASFGEMVLLNMRCV